MHGQVLCPHVILTCGSAHPIELDLLEENLPISCSQPKDTGYLEELPHLRRKETLNSRYHDQQNHFIDGKVEVLGH